MGTTQVQQDAPKLGVSEIATGTVMAPLGPTEMVGALDEDKLSSSKQAALQAQAEADKLTPDELHKELIGTYVSIGENCIIYQALVLSAKKRMVDGHKVGGCDTWTDYADTYLKRHDESLPTCLRRLRRLLEGVNPDQKHRNRRKKPYHEIVEQGVDQQHAIEVQQARDKGFEEGRVAERKAQEILSEKGAKLGTTYDPNPGVQLPSSITADLTVSWANTIARLKALTKSLKSESDGLIKTEANELARTLRTFSKDAAERAERLEEVLRVRVQ